jgi:hypothetical protein
VYDADKLSRRSAADVAGEEDVVLFEFTSGEEF